MPEAQKQAKAKKLGQEIDDVFAKLCWRLGVNLQDSRKDPLLSIELARLEKLLQNDNPEKTRPQKQHNGNGAG